MAPSECASGSLQQTHDDSLVVLLVVGFWDGLHATCMLICSRPAGSSGEGRREERGEDLKGTNAVGPSGCLPPPSATAHDAKVLPP